MKKHIVVLIGLALILSSIPTYAEIIYTPRTVEEAVQSANEQIGYEYYEVDKVNRQVWEKYGALVYDKPSGDKKGEEYRYLGKTPLGEPYTNYRFPHDDWAGGYLEDREWIETPWKILDNVEPNPFNNNPSYEVAIEEGLKTVYGDYFKGTKTDWYKYMQILQPPTDFTPGMGRMWHQGKTGIWYITVPIAPLKSEFVGLKKGFPGIQDYSTLIIRTGTESLTDSKPRANVQNEAVIEYRVTNSNENTGIAEIELEIKNAKNITVKGLLDAKVDGEKITGKLDMSEAYAYGELQKYADYITYPQIDMSRQIWQNNKDLSIRQYTASMKIYKDANGNYGNMTQNEYGEEHIARAIRVYWTVKDANRPVTMTSYMKPFDGEKNTENNKDIVIIQNDKYEFSCFNNYTITKNTIYKPGDPKNLCTFWMMRPIYANDELEEEFLVVIQSWRYQNGQEYPTLYETEPKYFKLNKDNPIVAIDFVADTPRYTLTIYRKGQELDEYKNDEIFKSQYFMGYEKTYNGEKYYYYRYYHSYDDGFFYPTKLAFSYMREDKAREFIGRYGYKDFDKWNEAIK